MRSGKQLNISTIFTMILYMLCGLCLFFHSQRPLFAHAAISSDTNCLFKRDVISSEEEASEDGKFKSAASAHTISHYLHPDNKGDSVHDFIAVFLKQLAILHFSLRSPPILSP